jgi:hypothetical protein
MPNMGTITAISLNEDGTLNISSLKDKYKEARQKFLDELRPGVVVKFSQAQVQRVTQTHL